MPPSIVSDMENTVSGGAMGSARHRCQLVASVLSALTLRSCNEEDTIKWEGERVKRGFIEVCFCFPDSNVPSVSRLVGIRT